MKTESTDMKRNLINRFFHVPTRREREEAYLARSVDIYDVERRIRELEAGKYV